MFDEDSDLQAENEIDLDVEADEPEPEETEESEQREETKPKSSYVDFDKISDEEVRSQVKGRIGELYRKSAKAERLELEVSELKARLSERNAPKVLDMPSADLAIEDPREFAKQQEAYTESLIQQREYESQRKAHTEQTEALRQQQYQDSVKTYQDRISALKVDRGSLREASAVLESVGIAQHMEEFFLNDEHGPALVVALGNDPDEIDKILSMSPLNAAAYIERVIKPKVVQKKKPSAPPPPTKVQGSRGSPSTGSSGRRYI